MLTGGGPNKEGNNYEAYWGVERMLDVLAGKARSIRIEEPGVPGMEFYVVSSTGREYWQCKEFESNRGAWNISRLKAAGVLDAIGARLANKDNRVVFASTSATLLLHKLEEEAKRVMDFGRFKRESLDGKERSHEFSLLCKYWGLGEVETFHRLLRLTVETESKRRLREVILNRITYHFESESGNVMDVLRTLYLDSSMVELTAEDIHMHLHSRGYVYLPFIDSATNKEAIESQTDSFIRAQTSLLILGELKLRVECDTIIDIINDRKGPHDIVLSGKAGGGKSGALLQLLYHYRDNNVGVLAMRLDRLAVEHMADLNARLGLSESPIRALVRAYPGQETVLILDQLDALSALSGRVPGMIDVFEKILSELQGARREGHKIHFVIACRQVDLDHDRRLRAFQGLNAIKATFDLFTLEQVADVLRQMEIVSNHLTAQQRELLQTPVNLWLFSEAHNAGDALNGLGSQYQLLERYWNHKREAVARRPDVAGDHWLNAITLLVQAMNRGQRLSVHESVMDDVPSGYRSAMLSEGVICLDSGQVHFGHECFLDYCAARLAIRGDIDPLADLLASQQDLFWRAQVRQVLTGLRASRPENYFDLLKGLIFDNRVRPHIKLVAIDVLFSFENPTDQELHLGLELAHTGLRQTSGSGSTNEWIAARAWEAFFRSRTWLPKAASLGWFDRVVQENTAENTERICHYLSRQTATHGDLVARMLRSWVDAGSITNEQLRRAVFMADLEHSGALVDVVVSFIAEGRLDQLGAHGIDFDLSKRNAHHAVKICSAIMSRWRALVNASGRLPDGNTFELLGAFSGNHIMEAARAAPESFLNAILPEVIAMAEKTAVNQDSPLLQDLTWAIRWERESHPSVSWAFVHGCESAFALVADMRMLDDWVDRLSTIRLDTVNTILMHAFITHPERYAQHAVHLLVKEPFRLVSGPNSSPLWYGREVLKLCTPFVDMALFSTLESTILDYTRSEGERVDYDHWVLASGLPVDRLSNHVAQLVAEWSIKFSKKRIEPQDSFIVGVYSPISRENAETFTNEDWINAMRAHARDDVHDREQPGKGGATELARMFEDFVKEDPDRFYSLMIHLPTDVNRTYFYHLLSGIRHSGLAAERKLIAAQLALTGDDRSELWIGFDLIRQLAGKIRIGSDIVTQLYSHALKEAKPEPTDGFGDNASQRLLNHGINTIPGSAILALGELLYEQPELADKCIILVEELIHCSSRSVLACAFIICCQLSEIDGERAVDLFLAMVEDEPFLLTTHYADRFFHWALHHHFKRVEHLLPLLLSNSDEEMHESGGRHAALVALRDPSQSSYLETAFEAGVQARIGIIRVARANLMDPKDQAICISWLVRSFKDLSQEVQKKAARCFTLSDRDERDRVRELPQLVQAFLESPAFDADPTPLLDAIDGSDGAINELALLTCERYLQDQGSYGSAAHPRDYYLASDLVFKCYHQLNQPSYRHRVLTLIDQLAILGNRDGDRELDKFDR
jgi:hypothetical protein